MTVQRTTPGAIPAVISETNVGFLRGALGGDADLADFVDAVYWYRHFARAITDHMDQHPRRRIRIIGESIWPDRTGLDHKIITYFLRVNTEQAIDTVSVPKWAHPEPAELDCAHYLRDFPKPRSSPSICDVTSRNSWSGGPFTSYVRRLARQWSSSARTWHTARRRRAGRCRGGAAGWDWPG